MATTHDYLPQEHIDIMPLEHFADRYDIGRLVLTNAGLVLAAEQPKVIDEFAAISQKACLGKIDTTTNPHLGSGRYSHVYGLTSTENACIKISSPSTQSLGYYHGKPRKPSSVPSLIAEAKLMNGIRKILESSENGIHSPLVYGATKTKKLHTLLLEKVPEDFTRADKALEKLGNDCKNELREYEKTLIHRVSKAVGKESLRHGIGDITTGNGLLNTGNLFLADPTDPEQTDIFVTDLMGDSKIRAAAAHIFGTLN